MKKMSDQVVADENLLREWIFEKKKAEVIFAIKDGKEVGFASLPASLWNEDAEGLNGGVLTGTSRVLIFISPSVLNR